jgi:hypothetical protein
VDVLQSWVAVGVPGLVLAAGLFVGFSPLRAWIGYGVLAALVVFFAIVPRSPASAAAIGVLAVALIAAGRGTSRDPGHREHHEDRRRFTTAAPEEG